MLAALLRTDAPLTGRQVHALINDRYSLWTVQQALTASTRLGLVKSQTIGRANVHTVNEEHVSIAPLRALLDPIAALTDTVREAVGGEVQAVILFGSIARGEATISSDIDLAVIAPADWDGRVDLQDAVRARLGNDCDVLVLTPEALRPPGVEPVVHDVLTEGIALIGYLPHRHSGVA